METCPPEILQQIFALSCTDAGHTGRSLSLVSKYIHDISSPFKYQSLAITRWRQIITFSQTFSQLPASRKKIKYLLVHCPYLFVDEEDNPLPSSSIDSEEERESSLEDARYLRSIGESPEEIETFFNNILQAFHTILNQSSSTLTILGVYWTSFNPLQIHELLPPLPFLQELHLYRVSNHPTYVAFDSEAPTKPTFFPRLLFLYISGESDYPLLDGHISFKDDLARIAPNLTHLRIAPHFLVVGYKPQDSPHPLSNPHLGGVIVENLYGNWSLGLLKSLVGNQFGTEIQFAFEEFEEKPNVWQRWWAGRVVGEVGPWRLSVIN